MAAFASRIQQLTNDPHGTGNKTWGRTAYRDHGDVFQLSKQNEEENKDPQHSGGSEFKTSHLEESNTPG